jgi:hypothetical protein
VIPASPSVCRKHLASLCARGELIITEPIHQPLPNILLPRTTLFTLSNPHISTTQVFEIAVALTNTAHQNRKDFTHQTELYEEAVARLKREARRPAPANDPPYGYIPNDNIAPYFTIPDRGGRLLMAPFLRRCPGDPTHVIGTMGTPNNDEEHLCPIYTAPRHSDGCSLAALPPWFLDLLHSQSPHAESIVESAINLGVLPSPRPWLANALSPCNGHVE